MASNQEKGRAKNISNFKLLHSRLVLFGPGYNPANPALKPASILVIHGDSKTLLQQFNTIDGQYKVSANDRKIVYAPVSKVITRSRSAIKSGAASAAVKAELNKDAGTLAKRYRGIRAKPIQEAASPDPNAPASDSISVAHTSYVQRAETFSQLIALYTSAGAGYAPTATETKLPALNALYTILDGHNTTVGDKISARNYTRGQLFKKLYGIDTGLVDIALAAKEAVREIFGSDSSEYKQIASITFTREEE